MNDTVAIEPTWEGTQTGPTQTPDGQEFPPSNRRATVKAVQVMEIEDGKIKTTRHYFDLMTVLGQIGAMEQAGATAYWSNAAIDSVRERGMIPIRQQR